MPVHSHIGWLDAGPRWQGDGRQPGSSGFDSHRRLLESDDTARPTAHAPCLCGSRQRVFRSWVLTEGRVNQVSSVGRAPDRESGCRGFDSRTKTAGVENLLEAARGRRANVRSAIGENDRRRRGIRAVRPRATPGGIGARSARHRRWQHGRVPCSAWIPLRRAFGKRQRMSGDLRRGLPRRRQARGKLPCRPELRRCSNDTPHSLV